MQILRTIFTLISFVIALMACSKNTQKEKNMNAMNNTNVTSKGKTLVVFFSHAGENYAVGHIKVGNTKIVADYITEAIGAEQFEIVPEKSYQMPYNQLIKVAQQETDNNEKPEFKGQISNLEEYDTIFIGGPIWWGTYPQVMFSFFDKYDLNGKTIVPFTTHEGSGLGSTVEDLKRIYPNAKVRKGYAIYGHKVRTAKQEVFNWLKGLE